MSRRTLVSLLTGGVLLGALGGPALASTPGAPVQGTTDRTCIITGDDGHGGSEGFCVWFPDIRLPR